MKTNQPRDWSVVGKLNTMVCENRSPEEALRNFRNITESIVTYPTHLVRPEDPNTLKDALQRAHERVKGIDDAVAKRILLGMGLGKDESPDTWNNAAVETVERISTQPAL
ncbi:MAG: hypothetical protein OQJ98_01410 [Candidatus Pacebacteria bacterium]|nr:hypothetical protein [Candidatus Paceibacterota bacterium]